MLKNKFMDSGVTQRKHEIKDIKVFRKWRDFIEILKKLLVKKEDFSILLCH